MEKTMPRQILCLLTLLCASCADIRNTADATSTVRLGAEALSAISIERSMTLGIDRLPVCLDVMITLPPDNTQVALQRTGNGCALSVSQPGLLIFDQQEIANARRASGPFDVNAVRRGSVSFEDVELWTDQGAPLDLARYVDAISVKIDDDIVLDRVAPSALLQPNGQPLSRPLPAALLDKLKRSVKNGQEATANVSLILILHGDTLSDLKVVLQPQLEINVLDAAF
jgi:hypothetical protein